MLLANWNKLARLQSAGTSLDSQDFWRAQKVLIGPDISTSSLSTGGIVLMRLVPQPGGNQADLVNI